MHIDGHILTPYGIIPGIVEYHEGLICDVRPHNDVADRYILPGFIDCHVHGGDNADVMDGPEAIMKMSRFHAQHGVTTLYPTTMTRPWGEVLSALRHIKTISQNDFFKGASIPGAHLEGPFINSKKLGAQPAFAIQPTRERLHELLEIDTVRLTTLAPECCSHEALTILVHGGIRLSIGHTCATCEQCMDMISHVRSHGGVVSGTHLFNAMPEIRGRAPGPVAALLADDEAFMEMIFDTHHVHPLTFTLTKKIAGDRLLLVSDAMRATGCSDGLSSLGGQDVLVKDGMARLGRDGTGDLAGSILTLDQALKNACAHGASLREASAMLSQTPAAYMGLKDRGVIEVGMRADIVSIDECHNIQNVWIYGEQIR